MKEEGKKVAFIHILSSLSLVLSLYWECVLSSLPPPYHLLLLSDKCHSSLSLAATIDDLFRRTQREREREREREGKRDESET